VIRIWLSRDSDVPMHEQLSAQLVLGILSRRLKPGDRLPSVRSLARQFKIHPNTVSGVYGRLVERGWLDRRMGSGVYVSELDPDSFAHHCFDLGLRRGFSREALLQAFTHLTHSAGAQQFIVVDPDIELARILAAEIGEALHQEVPFSTRSNSYACALTTEAAARTLDLPFGAEHRIIRLNSLQDLLLGRERPSSAVLIAVVSASPGIRRWAGTLLSALGFPTDCVLIRDPAEAGWAEGLASCHLIAGDVLTAPHLVQHARTPPIIFRLVASDFLAELKTLGSNGTGPDT
jgi:DNA-binding transcriptional regulator YhcF (GntR family)